MKRQCLLSSTVEKNKGLRMELSRAWEPSVSSSVAQLSATMGSRFCVFIGNKAKKEEYGEKENECWVY